METYYNYKGYGISYSSITGDTTVDKYGIQIKAFSRQGVLKGDSLAREFIDRKCS